MAKPTFHGQLKDRPFQELLLEIYRWRLSGTLAVWPEQPKAGARQEDRIRLDNGSPVAGRFVHPAHSFRDALLSVMSRSRAVFAFYQHDFVGDGQGVIGGTVGIYDVLAESLRRSPRKDAIGKMLMVLRRGVIRIRPEADLEAFNFQGDERDFAKLLRAAPGELRSIMRFASEPHVAERVLLLLSLVNAIELEVPREGHVAHSILPPKLETGILTEEMFGPGVYQSSKTQEGPRNIAPRPRRTSGMQVRKSNSIPPIPQELTPELQQRWDAVVEAAMRMDDQDHFAVLGVDASASDGDIGEAYLRKVAVFHPDALPPELASIRPLAHRYVERLMTAREILTDSEMRSAYHTDYLTGHGSPKAQKFRAAHNRGAELFAEAKVCMRDSQWNDALDRLREARAFDHRDARILANEAWCRFNISPDTGSFPELVALIRQSLALDPSLHDAYLYLGMMNERLGRGKEARDAYRVLLRLKPDHEEARTSLKRLLLVDRTQNAKSVIQFPGRRRR